MTTTVEALDVAADFVRIVARCFAEPAAILAGAAHWTAHR
jgi:hypothetical protein